MKRRWTIFMVSLGLGLMAWPALAQIGGQPKPIEYTPEVPIPGVFDKTVQIDNFLLAKYLRGVYIYFIWSVGVLATVMVIYGGIKWVSAAGNPSRINDARETINSAIIGVIIALVSVVLLNIIDPNYTRFGLPDLNPVTGQSLTAQIAGYKNPGGSCKSSAEIPCGQVCVDLSRGNVYGNCNYCPYNVDEIGAKTCGEMKFDPTVTAASGNCVYTYCREKEQVCEKSKTALTLEHRCATEPRVQRLTEAGYGDLPVRYTKKYDCGSLFWEPRGWLGILAENLAVGRECLKGYNCVIDTSIALSITTEKADIPNNAKNFQIGKFNGSGCY